MYLQSITIERDRFPATDVFPFNVAAFLNTERIEFSSNIVFFVGRNGSGKSSLLDAIARRRGLLPWGGTKTHKVHKNPYETGLANFINLNMLRRNPYGFHFRAETFFNFAASLDDIIMDDPARDTYFGGSSLHTLSHGESFLAFFRGYSFQLDGLYLLDEPEAALSPENQAEFARIIKTCAGDANKQYVIATHSPIILGCPGAQILSFDMQSIEAVSYEQTGSYRFYKNFLKNPREFFDS
ncbi:AAA family ATPase [Desulfomonile tiedjei]|uniref:Putative ATPase n=1 Tax=Desulfomonile tiedjei (strain ATCC 49306 / DSM 6799 / DCB-1) TaxID=706587 RepID=I4C6T0_DESTA|nr:AAA family ATPase [Desulfomonile tiedjei]AFM25271.1 putative ATPase [Desulfomonile tiedjei DSM 6799]